MEVDSPSRRARSLGLRLRDDDPRVRLSLQDIVETLGPTCADALADQALALDAAGGVVRTRDGIRVRLTPSGVFLALAQEAGWKARANLPTTRVVPTPPPPRVPSVARAPSAPNVAELPQGHLHVTIKTKLAPTPIAAAPPDGRVYALGASGRVVTFTLQPHAYKRFDALDEPASQGVVVVITGKLGRPTPEGFELDEPAVQLVPPGGRPFAKERTATTRERL